MLDIVGYQYQSNQTNEYSIQLMESAIHIFGSLHKLLMSETNNITQIESIIYHYILPTINTQSYYLKFRVITVIGEYYRLTYESINTQHNIQLQQLICTH